MAYLKAHMDVPESVGLKRYMHLQVADISRTNNKKYSVAVDFLIVGLGLVINSCSVLAEGGKIVKISLPARSYGNKLEPCAHFVSAGSEGAFYAAAHSAIESYLKGQGLTLADYLAAPAGSAMPMPDPSPQLQTKKPPKSVVPSKTNQQFDIMKAANPLNKMPMSAKLKAKEPAIMDFLAEQTQ